MPDLSLCSRDDVLALGFSGDVSQAVKLTKSDPTAWNPAVLDTPILCASADVDMACGNKWSLAPQLDPAAYPFSIRKTTALRAVYYLWFAYRSGQVMPAEVKEALERSDRDLEQLRDSKKGLGSLKEPDRRIYGRADIDMTDAGRIPRMTLRGWELL